MRIETQTKIVRSMEGTIGQMFCDAIKEKWSSRKLQDTFHQRVTDHPRWKDLPVHQRWYVQGFYDGAKNLHERINIVFSYEIKGKRYSLDDPEYRKIDPCMVSSEYSHTGAFVYRDDLDKIWFKG